MKTIAYCLKTTMVSRCFVLFLILSATIISLQAQEKEQNSFQAKTSIDLVSQNIWRGVYQSGTSIQPSLSAAYKGFELFAWGTTDFQSAQREVDLTLSYTFYGFTLGITDYWNGNDTTAYSRNHLLEANLSYTFSRIPLTLQWNSVFCGEKQARSFSSYAAISYTLELPIIDFDFSVGFTPWKNTLLETERFAFTNLSVSAGKSVYLHSCFGLRPSCTLLYNPSVNQMYFVAGISFFLSTP